MGYDEDYKKTDKYFGDAPDRVLVDQIPGLDPSEPVLDLGAGQGRNALILAERGLTVHAVDPSATAMDAVKARAESDGLPILTFAKRFEDFDPHGTTYSGILLFGLIQVLSWETITLLRDRIMAWLRPEGLLFATAHTTEDPAYARHAGEWKRIGRNSFESEEGEIRTFLEPGEITRLFPDLQAVHHWEGIGPSHRHGDGPMERHARAEAVFERRITS